jgi:hypothetical protein
VEPDDINGISLALTRLYDLWQAGELMRFAPSEAQVRSVTPEQVIPIYEQAFQSAIEQAA